MFDRMVHEHGYSIRKLAEKLGKDKGYLENRLRLADAPEEIRQLVSLRKDTVSHAYELLKVEDPKKRKRLAAQVASGELSLVKLREKIEGRRPRVRPEGEDLDESIEAGPERGRRRRRRPPAGTRPAVRLPPSATTRWSMPATSCRTRSRTSSSVLRAPDVIRDIPEIDRANLAKYLTIAKLKLENAIAIVRSGDSG